MSIDRKTPTRTVKPRKWTALTAAGLIAVQPVIAQVVFTTPSHAAESGEAGEAGIEMSEGPSAFLTRLGYFEGTYRIAAELYLIGERDGARAHLEESHHAFYEDIEDALVKYAAPGFSEEAAAFLKAISEDAANDEVSARLAVLLTAMAGTADAAQASAYDRLLSIRELVALAAAEYEGGVDEGRVELAIEYRDSWGFLAVAKIRALSMMEGEDEVLAKAGGEVLEQLEGTVALYPGLTATEAAKDASQLAVAAGWIEIIALRQR
ncbi:hypothetical protein RXV86_01210 [Alisedimentitalea sp. MJ-SS2]|uniref:hypothetical protein n=1 Tax=Aliisedimentitalea sp. MJ-SS2 TaxID=3049795 RepID=UPI00290D8F66|nr:hypothetical protein [Alisedimentitalea sp. MJ-SS2]MDU8925993.1 hypothetical protein [Alisedimentitalea sp. MJ-SS2]